MKNNRILAFSIITLLSSAHGVANAAAADIALTAAGSNTPFQFAKELPTSTADFTLTGKTVSNLIPTGVNVSPTNNVYVKFNLLNGAKFKTDPGGLACKDNAAAAINTNKTLGGAGFSYVTYQVVPLDGAGVATSAVLGGTSCVLSLDKVTLSSGLTDKKISATVEYNDAGTNKVLASKGQFITFTQALAVTYEEELNPVKIDVRQSSKQFVNAAGTNSKIATLGKIFYTKIGKVLNADGNELDSADALTMAKLTITGPVVGSVHSGNIGTSGIYLVTTAVACAAAHDIGTNPTTSNTTYSGTSVTFNAIDVADLAAGAGIKVCVVGDGAKVLSDGQITASLSAVTVPPGFVPDLTAARNSLGTLKKNGAATKALVLPDPNQSDKPYVRIYNIGSSTGRVLGTLYGVDGKAIASGVLSAGLAPNATVVLGAPDIAKALGIAGWTGRPWLQIEAEFQGLRAQALIRSSTGVLTEFSDAACGTSTLCGE